MNHTSQNPAPYFLRNWLVYIVPESLHKRQDFPLAGKCDQGHSEYALDVTFFDTFKEASLFAEDAARRTFGCRAWVAQAVKHYSPAPPTPIKVEPHCHGSPTAL